MTFEQLRIFLAVAEHLHFTRAAEELYITQPAVSAAIQSLEQQYSVKLFHRVGRHIEIAEAGKLLQVEAKKILDQVALTERGLRELNNLQRGELKLGASLTIGNYWLPNKISQFKTQYPGIFVNCTLGNAEEICEGTATGLFDLGLITGEVKPSLQSCLEQERVGSDRLQIVVGKSHPWFGLAEISLTELSTTSWVMREAGSGAQQMFEQALQNWGIAPTRFNVVLVLNSSEMVKAVVEGGVGAAAIPELMVQKELQLSTLHAVNVVDDRKRAKTKLEIAQPVLKLKHQQRFQTQVSIAFEKMLISTTLSTIF
ncbi:LysR family transcriptional regulator [Coleofasciculus sp. FACHB-64]|uniref:LysR substrate-binding domain-containing protein n=1 Tax=Cyanophyceae TaxID=3028117 RepID=UPI001682B26F|nr:MULTISPECIES: LysR substrate-binding domain-containing protein [unclassified Coleofasciculus]MBD1840002.1 LysR family transcriptional regulator [Coleofasciculus sp. FACHB-501]MBD2048292.1 LysR family transcriptional regulator [Coleofasciculus sp. FACHB-64]